MSDRKTTETMFLAAYHGLRRLARGKLYSERPDRTLQALAHEVWPTRSTAGSKDDRSTPLGTAVTARWQLPAKRRGRAARLSVECLAIVQ